MSATVHDRITRMQVFVARMPVTSRRSHGIGDTSDEIRNVFVRLETQSGAAGWGEAAPWPAFAGTAEASAAALDSYLRPLVIDADPRKISAIMARADKVLKGHADAKAGLETALFDLLGRINGIAVAELLGGRCCDSVPLSVSLANPDFDADLKLCERIHGDGVRIFKLKTGFAGHDFDLMRLRALRDQFSDVDLRVDYNQGLTPFEAWPRLKDIEAYSPSFIEQPVEAQHRAAMAELKRRLDTPLIADESIFSPEEAFSGAAQGIADGVSIKIFKSGGLRKAQTVARIAHAAGMAAYGGDMMETGLAHLAGLHMVAATPEITLGCEFYQDTYYFTEGILNEPMPISDGMVHVPDGPGLGITINEKRLAELTESSAG